jgi:NAD(P)H-nitrite reductase large subunit
MAVVTVGVAPNIDLVKGTEINLGTGIIVDENMRTNIGNVYAAGDVAEAIDIVTKERRINAIWPNAIRQGRVAAYSLVGIESKYDGSDRMNVIDIFGMPIVSIGHRVPDSEEIGTRGKRIVLKNNRIAGLTFIGNIRSAGVILSLIRKGVDISKIRDIILKDEFGYGKVAKFCGGAVASGLERGLKS